MTDLLTPKRVQVILDLTKKVWPGGKIKHLCRDYLTLWDRNKELKADLQDMYDARGTGFRRCECGHMTETTFICNGCGK